MTEDKEPLTRGDRRNRYVAALLTVAATILLAFMLRDYLARSIFILFAAPVALTAWYGGRNAALLAAFASLVAVELIFVDRVYGVVPRDAPDILATIIFIFVSLAIAHVGGLFSDARENLFNYDQQLETQSRELRAQTEELEQQTEEAQTLNEELEQLNESIRTRGEAQLAEAQALAKLGSWEWDIEKNSIKWSDELYRIYGLEPDGSDIDFERYQSMLHPDDRPLSEQAVEESLASREPFTLHHRIVRPDGEVRTLLARGKVIVDSAGKPIRMIGTGQDVTEARRAEAVLRSAAEFAAKQKAAEAAAQHFDRVLAQAPVVMAVLTGPDHVFQLANARAVEMLGVEDVVGKPLREAIPTFAGGQYEKLVDMVYESGHPFVGREMFVSIKPGESDSGGYFNFVVQPLTSDEGVYAILVVANEVTDLVTSRMQAEHNQQLAQAASRTKSDFLARMSHELRTPLAAIIGYGELLADGITGPVNEEQSRQLGRIRSSANHLLSIIDEILTLARMEAGKEGVNVQDVDVRELLDSVSSMAEPLAANKGLEFRLDQVTPLTMQTDPMKLRQVLLNLISNAVKYTEAGEVALGSRANDEHIDFLVRDTGVGIAEEHLDKIFEPFWQVEQTTTRRSGGTGLGLAVTKQFVELLGGRIGVESEIGRGSTFMVTLPVQLAGNSGVAGTLDA